MPEKFAVFGYGQPPIVIYHVVTILSAGNYFLIMMGKLEEITRKVALKERLALVSTLPLFSTL